MRRWPLWLAAALLTAGVLPAQAQAPAGSDQLPPAPVPVFPDDDGRRGVARPGQYLIELGTADPASLPPEAGRVVRPVGHGWYLLEGSPTGAPAAVAAALTASSGRQVVPNRVFRQTADEPFFPSQWGLENDGDIADIGPGTVDADVDAQRAWAVTSGRPAVVVAIIDSGLDLTHPEFSGQLWVNEDETPANGTDDDGNGYVDDLSGIDTVSGDADPTDLDGHGTFVAGIIGAAVDGAGISGLAPDVRLLIVRACSGLLCDESAVIEAIDYAVANGADVLNLSFGGESFGSGPLDIVLAEAAAAGTVLVAAAGNGGFDGIGDDNDLIDMVPANHPDVVAVAATDRFDQLTDFSNYGATTVDLAAPGDDILSTERIASLFAGYAIGGGTSFAAPFTAAAAALALSAHPCLSPSEVAALLRDTTDPLPVLATRTISGGRLNAGSAAVAARDGAVAAAPVVGGAPLVVDFSLCHLLPAPAWDFGDGGASALRSPTHTYRTTGIYQATVSAGGIDYGPLEVVVGLDFVDIAGSVFAEDIYWLSAVGITRGCNPPSNDRFCPADGVTRGQMAAFLVRALGLGPGPADRFVDDDNSVFEDDIDRLAAASVTKGCNPPTNDRFCPDDVVGRGQMAAFLHRALG